MYETYLCMYNDYNNLVIKMSPPLQYIYYLQAVNFIAFLTDTSQHIPSLRTPSYINFCSKLNKFYYHYYYYYYNYY